MKFEHTEVWGFYHAIRGMRNPLESWNKSDSDYCFNMACEDCAVEVINKEDCYMNPSEFVIGKNDLALMQRLIKAGSEHRKFMRQIMVAVDVTAPMYFFSEFDTYKVGTVANSTSKMHKLASTPITIDCFEMGDFDSDVYVYDDDNEQVKTWKFWKRHLIPYLEELRKLYNETKDKSYWKELIRLLPESWLQTRTITMNYENVLNMINHRSHHKLSEWSVDFINWAKTLPYANELLFITKDN